MKTKHYSPRTIEAYSGWVKKFVLYHNKKHPKEMGGEEIQQFISHLSVDNNVSASTQNQALQGILYLYKNVLKKDVGWITDIKKATRIRHLPSVFSRDEVRVIMNCLNGVPKLFISLLYGTGMRLTEGLRLRIKDVDFEMNQIIIRDGKGEKDRITVLPQKLIPQLKEHIRKVRNLHEMDLKQGFGETVLPYALDKKYINASKEFGWQYVFPSKNQVYDKKVKKKLRIHIHESVIQKEVRKAVRN